MLAKFTLLSLEQAQTVAKFLVFQCERCIFLYEQEELGKFKWGGRFWAFVGDYGYKSLYRQFKWALDSHWKQFLDPDFVLGDFPYSEPRRLWRELWKSPDPHKKKIYEEKKAALIAEIYRAFDGVQREDGVTLHETGVIDNYGSPEERAAARALDTETRWQDVPSEDAPYCDPIFLDAKGFHYYCPVLLIAFLHEFDCEDEFPRSDNKIHFILEHPLKDKELSFHKYFVLFSTEQKRAIARFLQFRHDQWNFYLERSNIRRDKEDLEEFESRHAKNQLTLDTYWSQFL